MIKVNNNVQQIITIISNINSVTWKLYPEKKEKIAESDPKNIIEMLALFRIEMIFEFEISFNKNNWISIKREQIIQINNEIISTVWLSNDKQKLIDNEKIKYNLDFCESVEIMAFFE